MDSSAPPGDGNERDALEARAEALPSGSGPSPFDPFRGVVFLLAVVAIAGLGWVLRSVLGPLTVGFLLAYALDPFVDRLETLRVPRAAGAALVMLALSGIVVAFFVYVAPWFVAELRDAAKDLPEQLAKTQKRAEPWLWTHAHLKMPHNAEDWGKMASDRIPGLSAAATAAAFGTLTYVGLAFSALVVPVFALYLLIDFDRIVRRVRDLVPRRWLAPVSHLASDVHTTLGSWVRGQVVANFVLAALYATALRFVGIRLAVPIGILTGMLAFIPYVGFSVGLVLALAVSVLDWQGPLVVLEVAIAMVSVQILDGFVVTPRIVGQSVGLSPLEVLLAIMGAGTLFGFFGVFLAVPIGAVTKLLIKRAIKSYLKSEFYRRRAADARF
jgi:predicted PurR-regulated permease PerM